MKTLPAALLVFLKILVPVLVILAVTLTGIRLLLTQAFIQIEYRMPGFPADPYGFTQADRLHWASFAVDYLVNDAGTEYLGDLTFEDGEPLYNERELRHMDDVKRLTQQVLVVWGVAWVLLLILGVWAWRGGWLADFTRMLGSGGKALCILIAALVVGIALGFNALFTGFHLIFFEGDTWLFNYSDTLIRLFPMRFWLDIFIAAGLLSLAGGLALWFAFGRKRKAKRDE